MPNWEWYKPALTHYKHRIDRFLQDEKVKDLASSPFRQDLEELSFKVKMALLEWENIWPALSKDPVDADKSFVRWEEAYNEIISMSKQQFEKDYKTFKQIADSELGILTVEKLEKLKKLYDALR
jgi:hypothetical protein